MAIPAGNGVFIDTNILVYASDDNSPFNPAAKKNLDLLFSKNLDLFVNVQVLREYVVVITRARPDKIADAWKGVRKITQQFQVLDDDTDCFEKLLELSAKFNFSGKQIHDANIVACMLENEIYTILTHNVDDFKRFSSAVKIINLE
jgi:predicted nucleic acid-binding protein